MKKKKYNGALKEIKMYNVMFPVWLLFFFPVTWLLVIPANFVVDSLVLLFGMYCLKIDEKLALYKKSIIWVFIFGFLADFIGGALLLITQFIGEDGFFYEYITAPVSQNPFDNIYALLYTVLAVVVSGVFIYIFNRFISLRKCGEKRIKRFLSLLLAVLTAPYLFLVPTSSLYGGQSESFTNHIVWSDYIQAEVYLAEDETTDILAVESGEHYNYVLVSSFRDGINTAKKVKKTNLGEWDYKVIFYKIGKDSNTLDEILICENDGNFYFEWENKCYKISEEYEEDILEEIESQLNLTDEDVEITDEEKK